MSRRNRDRMAQQAADNAVSEAARTLANQRYESTDNDPVDPEKDTGLERIAPRNDPRNNAFAEIERRDLETKGMAEAKPAEELAPDPVPPTPEQMLQGDKFSQPEPVAEVPEVTPVVEAPKLETVRVKVDGEEFDVPKEEVEAAGGIPLYQKQRAADNRLEKANKLIEQTRQAQAQMAQWAQSFQQQHQPQAPQLSNDEFIAQQMETIRFGTAEEGAKALNAILSRTQQRIDPGLIVAQATTSMRHDMAERGYRTEFQDIVSNPMLKKLSDAVIREKLAPYIQGNQVNWNALSTTDWDTFYRNVGNEIRGAVGRQNQPVTTPQAATADTTSPVDKESRKANIVNLPTAAARAELPKGEKPETRADVLESMKKRRGLPVG